jgi:hypothetical protein
MEEQLVLLSLIPLNPLNPPNPPQGDPLSKVEIDEVRTFKMLFNFLIFVFEMDMDIN